MAGAAGAPCATGAESATLRAKESLPLMPRGPKTLVDGLADEILHDMAASYFGARKEVEELRERADALAEELRPKVSQVLAQAATFQGLLPGPEAVREVYVALGVPPEPFIEHVVQLPLAEALHLSIRPWAWTGRGRYEGRVLGAYGQLQASQESLLHGVYETDAIGRKILKSNLNGLKTLVRALNERIAAVNGRSSQVLRMAHSMDVQAVETERMLGGTLDDLSSSVDRDMAYIPVDFAAYGLVDLPELPAADVARRVLPPVLSRVYAAHEVGLRAAGA